MIPFVFSAFRSFKGQSKFSRSFLIEIFSCDFFDSALFYPYSTLLILVANLTKVKLQKIHSYASVIFPKLVQGSGTILPPAHSHAILT